MMVTPTVDITNIPAPRVPFMDGRTGLISREWYRFLLNLFTLTGSGKNNTSLDDLLVLPPSSDVQTFEAQQRLELFSALEGLSASQLDVLSGRVHDLELLPPATPPIPEASGGTTVLVTTATITVSWPGSLGYSGDVAFAGITSANKIVCSLAPHLDSDENDAEMLAVSGLSALAGSAVATVKMAFSELTSGPIKLNLMAV